MTECEAESVAMEVEAAAPPAEQAAGASKGEEPVPPAEEPAQTTAAAPEPRDEPPAAAAEAAVQPAATRLQQEAPATETEAAAQLNAVEAQQAAPAADEPAAEHPAVAPAPAPEVHSPEPQAAEQLAAAAALDPEPEASAQPPAAAPAPQDEALAGDAAQLPAGSPAGAAPAVSPILPPRVEVPPPPEEPHAPALLVAESPAGLPGSPEPRLAGGSSFAFSSPPKPMCANSPHLVASPVRLRPGSRPGSALASPTRGSMDPKEARALKAASRRQAAAEWVAAQTGIRVPHESDAAFRAALRDGVTLCRLLNTLRPGSVSRVIDRGAGSDMASPTGDVIQTFENVANFIHASQRLVGSEVPLLSAADLEDSGERPQVADAILALQDWWWQQQQGVAPHAAMPALRASTGGGWVPTTGVAASGSWAPRASAAGTPPPQPPSPPLSPADFSFTPHAATAVHRAGGQQRADGLEYLMRTCNHMLKSSMGMPATPLPPPPSKTAGVAPEVALDAVGPVLETVLQNLTAEYEKRLLAKDQEFKLGQEAQDRMRREISRLKQEVVQWKEQAAAIKYLPAPGLSEEERAELERQVREKEEEAIARQEAAAFEIARKEAELQRVQEIAALQVMEADQKLSELSQEVQNYRDLNERYRHISEENRRLYNTVQDLRGSIRVFCRVRPRGRTGDSSACMVEIGEEGMLNVFSQRHNKWNPFKFDRVFGEASTQEDVYAETQPLIRSVLDGYNVCIFAYGQTGSGKTHTMSGTDIDCYANRGINYRALDDLFELNRQRSTEVEYSITVQLLEIYNEAIRDLLVAEGEARQQRSLQIVNSQRSGFNVPDAIQVPVACTEDVLDVMDRGQRNRAVAETKMNERSSRSHQVLTVMVEGNNKITHARTHGCLHLIDLAGSERVGKSGAEGQQLLEAQHINKSLSALGNVMHSLASKSAHVPFRDSKLTQLLQDSLSGQAKTMMFMHVAPEMTSVSETLSTLNFGRGVTEITLGAAKKNAESGAAWEAKERAIKSERDAQAAKSALAAEQQRNAQLQAELDALRAQLAHAACSPGGSSEDEGSLRAYRPAAVRASFGGSNGGTTPRSRLSLTSVPAAAAAGGGRLTPRGGAAGGNTTPRSSSLGGRPPQASRSGAKDQAASGGKKPLVGVGAAGPTPGVRPQMVKLNLQKLHEQRTDADENKTPLSARVAALSACGTPADSGSGTPRSARRTSPGSSTNWLVDASDSEGEGELSSPTAAVSPRLDSAAAAAGQVADDLNFHISMSPPKLGRAGASHQQQRSSTASRPAGMPRLAIPVAGAARSSNRSPERKQGPPRSSTGTGGKPQALSRIPAPSPTSGSLTARGSSKSPALSSIPREPLSARESAADATARRAALQQKAGGAARAASLRGSTTSDSMAALRRSAPGPLKAVPSSAPLSARGSGSSSGTLNSGLRSSVAATSSRRWA